MLHFVAGPELGQDSGEDDPMRVIYSFFFFYIPLTHFVGHLLPVLFACSFASERERESENMVSHT